MATEKFKKTKRLKKVKKLEASKPLTSHKINHVIQGA